MLSALVHATLAPALQSLLRFLEIPSQLRARSLVCLDGFAVQQPSCILLTSGRYTKTSRKRGKLRITLIGDPLQSGFHKYQVLNYKLGGTRSYISFERGNLC